MKTQTTIAILVALASGCGDGPYGSRGDDALHSHTRTSPESLNHVTQTEAEARIRPSRGVAGSDADVSALVSPWREAFVGTPVLAQADSDASATLALIGALGVLADDEPDFFQAACSLRLGRLLSSDDEYENHPDLARVVQDAALTTYPNGEKGSLLSIELAQAHTFGVIDSAYYSGYCDTPNPRDPSSQARVESVGDFRRFATPTAGFADGEIRCTNYRADRPNCQCTSASEPCESAGTLVQTLKETIDAGQLAAISTIVFEAIDNLGLGLTFYPFSEPSGELLPNVWDLSDAVRACRTAGADRGRSCEPATHELIVFGYIDHPSDPAQGMLVLRNSWGPDLGDGGAYFMTYEYAEDLITAIATLSQKGRVRMHTNAVTFYFPGFDFYGPDVMDVSAVRVSEFELLESQVTDGQAPNGHETLYCSTTEETFPCSCFEDARADGQDGTTCGLHSGGPKLVSDLKIYAGRHKTKGPADWFKNRGTTIPLPAAGSATPGFYQDKGGYPPEVNFAFKSRVTFRLPANPQQDGEAVYASCQDMLFAQSSGKKIEAGAHFAANATKDSISVGLKVGEIVTDAASVFDVFTLGLDVGEFVDALIDFLIGKESYWYLTATGSAGYSAALVETAADEWESPSLAFKCPATNGSYYVVRIATRDIFRWSPEGAEFVVHFIQILDDRWTDDPDVDCVIEDGTKVVCDPEALPHLDPQ